MSYPKIEKPTEPGRYWYRAPDGAWEVVLVYAKGGVLFIAWHGCEPSPFAMVRIAPGDWLGPIPPSEPTP